MARVETLTPAQWEDMRSYRAHVLETTRASGPADREAVEQGVRACYQHIGLPDPAIVWVDGPTAVPLAGWIIDQLGGQLWGQLRGQLRGQLWDQLRGQLGDQIVDQIGGQLWDQLWDQLRDQLWDQLWDQLGDQLRDQLGDQLGGLAHWGFAYSAWDHHYRWISTIVPKPPPAEQLALLDHWINASSAGVWLPLNGVAIMSEKHTACHVDSNGALHHETRPAWEWADGTKIWAWRGTRVPEWVITDCTLDRIGRETNTEIRRCAVEHYGWDRYLTSIGAAPVDEADDPGNPGHVLRLFDTPEQIYSEPTRLLVMSNASLDRDGTRRAYAETVPAEIGSAVAAAAWQFGVDADMYRQLERAT